jgi:hypothetical protein
VPHSHDTGRYRGPGNGTEHAKARRQVTGSGADAVIDSGVFHVFGDDARARYVASLAGVLRPPGALLPRVLQRPAARTWGPRRVRADELLSAFSDGWAIT